MVVGALPALQTFQREPLIDCIAELLPLAERHFQETARYGTFSPDMPAYEALDGIGWLRCFTVRQASELVGYCLMIVRRHQHSNQLRAIEDLLYIRPDCRGRGGRFVAWIDEQLTAEGVQAVYRAVQVEHDHGRVYERQGYLRHEVVWSKSLEVPHG